MEHPGTVGTVGGNTKSPTVKIAKKSRAYAFTLNNWTSEEYNNLMEQFSANSEYIFGKEIGESKTPHIQGYLYFKYPRSFDAIKKLIPRAHIERAKGSKKDNFIYCAKDGDYKTNMKGFVVAKKVKDPLEGREFKPFQLELINIIKEEPDDRSIYWYWEKKGNVGKTSVCKHLCMNYNCIILNGKQNDMFNAILQWKLTKGDFPSIIIIDIPRSTIDYVSWGAIEKIKDGLFYSGKYEGGMVIMNCPHVICMANSEPDKSNLSVDRWIIKRIDT